MATNDLGVLTARAEMLMSYDAILPLLTHGQGLQHNYFWVSARQISSLLGRAVPTTTVGLIAVALASYAILLTIVFIQRRLRKRPRETKQIE